MTETLALYDDLMKDLYAGKAPENVAARNRAFLSMVAKKASFYGRQMQVPVIFANPVGRSATAATAYTSSTTGGKKALFTVTRSQDYASVNLDGELIHSSKNDRGAFLSAVKVETDGMLDELGHSLSLSLYRNGGGARGKIASISTNTITLVDAEDTANFKVGMVLENDTTDGSSGGAVDTGSSDVTNINEEAGTIELTSGTNFVANDFLFADGDFGNMLEGLSSYIPVTAGTLYGLDQTEHREMLAGTYISDTSFSIEESILVTAERVAKRGGRPDKCFISHEKFTNLVFGRESKVVTHSGGMDKIGFRGFPVDYSGGTLLVHPDPDCPPNDGFVLTMRSWELHHLEGLPHIVKDDGIRALRNSGADSIQIRGRYFAALVCYAPAWNGRFAIA